MTEPTHESLRAEFPGWYVSRGTDNRWHARLRGTRPPVTVADDDLEGLREEIIRKASQLDLRAWKDLGREALSAGRVA
jgi:hypothetical protein